MSDFLYWIYHSIWFLIDKRLKALLQLLLPYFSLVVLKVPQFSRSIDSSSAHDIVRIVKSMLILNIRSSNQHMSSPSFGNWQSSLLLKWDLVNDQKEATNIAQSTTAENDEDHDLAVDEEHVEDTQHLVPSIQHALFLVFIGFR